MKLQQIESCLNFCKKQTTDITNTLLSLKKYIKKVTIKDGERGLLFKNGVFKKVLTPGSYHFPPLVDIEVHTVPTTTHITLPGYSDLSFLMKDRLVAKSLIELTVLGHQLGLHYEGEQLKGVYQTGHYLFFKTDKKHTFKMIDKRDSIPDPDLDPALFTNPLMAGTFYNFHVLHHEAGLLYIDNRFEQILPPGCHHIWAGVVYPKIEKVDLRQQQIEITGQELMSRDKITLRLNFVAHYRVVDPEKLIHTVNNYTGQLYTLLQLALREYVGLFTLDELLKKREDISEFVLNQIRDQVAELGVEFKFCGIKDIILPGDIKEMLNTVLLAEKQAQANMIKRREETASTRSLLNTAKLLDQNKTLMKLKEMEHIETICAKIDQITLESGEGINKQLKKLVNPS